MNRRDFLGKMARLGFVASGTGLGTTFIWDQTAAAAARPDPTLAVAKGADHAALVDRAMAKLGGMSAFVRKNARVVVKPNIAWNQAPEMAANTNPVVVKRVVELCLKAGAKDVLVFDNSCDHAPTCYKNSGIQAAVKSIGDRRVRIEHVDERLFLTARLKHGKNVKKWSFYKPCLLADCFINVPVAKHHGSSRLTLAMKNMMGAVGGNRGRLHWGLHQSIADLNTVLKPHLIIMDGTRIMTDNGPSGGSTEYVKKIDTVVAGRDPVAVDAYSTRWFGLRPADLGFIRIGHQMGLGTMNLSRVKILAA
jgi:uncharacterized protein (DUF362 family)